MARIVIVPTGLVLSFATALVTLGGGLVVLAASADVQAGLDLLALAAFVAQAGLERPAQVFGLVWEAVLALALAPIALIAALGEIIGWREPVFYAGCTGVLTAAMPTIARAILALPVQGFTAAEGRLTLLLFLAGVASGGVYWLVARRGAPER